MKKRQYQSMRTMFVVAAASLLYAGVGCGPSTGGQPVDHKTTTQNLESNSKNLSERVSNSSTFLESSDLFSYSFDMYDSGGGEACTTDSQGNTTCESTESEEYELDIDTEVQEGVEQALAQLKKQVFTEDNIETQTETSITYRLKGDDVCSEDQENYQQCVDQTNKMRYRVRVTSPNSGTLKFTAMIGPDRYTPVSFELGKNHLAATADLGDIKRTVEYTDKVYGTESASELPSTLEGQVRAELRSKRDDHAHFEIKIEKAINVSGNDFQAKLAQAAKPVFGVTADGKSETLTSTVNFNAIEASFPVEYMVGEPQPVEDGSGSSGSSSEPEYETVNHALKLAGLTSKSTYKAGSEELKIENISLGDSSSWLKMNGKKAITVDLNPNHGRSYGVTVGVEKSGDSVEALTFDVSPAFDLQTAFSFSHVKDLVDVDDYLVDYEFQATLDGSDPASLRASENGLEVTSGQLKLSSKNPAASKTAMAGQCLEEQTTEPATNDGSGSDGGSGSSSDYHPLKDIQVTDCSGSSQ